MVSQWALHVQKLVGVIRPQAANHDLIGRRSSWKIQKVKASFGT